MAISEKIQSNPRHAIDSLKVIDPKNLTEDDSYYYDFLCIKAQDKAYLPHKSDSLVLSVLDYYSKNQNDTLYIEALYYAGRVKSDLGDNLTALKYYQQALIKIKNKKSLIHLRGNILSQMGWLFNHLSMSESAAICQREVMKINELERDTVNLSFNHNLLGNILLGVQKTDSAEMHLKKAYNLSKSNEQQSYVCINLANYYYKLDIIDSALYYIRKAQLFVWEDSRDFLNEVAIKIYDAAGIKDTALIYARDLINSEELERKTGAYKILINHSFEDNVSPDSLRKLLYGFNKAINDKIRVTDAESVIIQNSQYNYSSHELARREAEKAKDDWRDACLITSVILLVISTVAYTQIIKKKNLQLRYIKSVEELKEIRRALEEMGLQNDKSQEFKADSLSSQQTDNSNNSEEAQESLKTKYLETLINAAKNDSDKDRNPGLEEFKNSDLYREIEHILLGSNSISDKSELWKNLDDYIQEKFPEFRNRLNMLSTELSPDDYRLASMIKCGIKPFQATSMLNLSKQAVTARRKNLCKKLTGDGNYLRLLDNIIRLI